MSPPSRGAWIEIESDKGPTCVSVVAPPRGGRGLKSVELWKISKKTKSPPSRGAWIEMILIDVASIMSYRRPPRGGRGLKFNSPHTGIGDGVSPPSRGAWIEIEGVHRPCTTGAVAPLAGGVD